MVYKYSRVTKMIDPFVSISCITFNHVNYISECIEGFLMQKTTFPFELLIHDDASTDGTTEIIKNYQKKYPEIIKPLYEDENQWSKGRMGSAVFNFPRAKGKYIALCEGDDYWIDPYKLQKQVDFMEKKMEYSFCCHNAVNLHNYSGYLDLFNKKQMEGSFNLKEYIESGGWFVPTASLLIRNSCLDKVSFDRSFYNGDIFLQLSLLIDDRYKMYYSDEVMCVYRRMVGVSSKTGSKEWCSSLIELYEYIDNISNKRYHDVIETKINSIIKFRKLNNSIKQKIRSKVKDLLEKILDKRIS